MQAWDAYLERELRRLLDTQIWNLKEQTGLKILMWVTDNIKNQDLVEITLGVSVDYDKMEKEDEPVSS